MSTDVEKKDGTGLAISSDQTDFTSDQMAVLKHMGIGDAPPEERMVFLHQCARTGLDPFAKQIHMIKRMQWNPDTRQKEPRWTIQTGIDGFRLMGHRAAARRRESVSIEPYEWMDEGGSWRPVWSVKRWGYPLAARVTVIRGGNRFTATANFDEYAQTKAGGDLNQMWSTRPAGQIAKCAEALAWRMAFPQDMAGIYTDDEMGQADGAVVMGHVVKEEPKKATASLFRDETVASASEGAPEDDGAEDAVVMASSEQLTAMFEAFDRSAAVPEFAFPATSDAGKKARMAYISAVVERAVSHTNELTADEVTLITSALEDGEQR